MQHLLHSHRSKPKDNQRAKLAEAVLGGGTTKYSHQSHLQKHEGSQTIIQLQCKDCWNHPGSATTIKTPH